MHQWRAFTSRLLMAAIVHAQEHGACPIHRVSTAVAALSGGARLWEGSG